MFWVYVILNSENKKIYIGQTNDLESRLKRHNGLLPTKVVSYTKKNKGNGVWKIVFKEMYVTRTDALHREKYLKSHVGRDWLHSHLGR